MFFLAHKNETFSYFSKFARKVHNENGYTISYIKTNHEGEFDNQSFSNFCEENGFQHNFSIPYTLDQNGVVERKNRSLQEMTKTLLIKSKIPSPF